MATGFHDRVVLGHREYEGASAVIGKHGLQIGGDAPSSSMIST